MSKKDVCPNCGYCPHCGRGAAPLPGPWTTPVYPMWWWPNLSPWWWQPAISSGTITSSGTSDYVVLSAESWAVSTAGGATA